MKDQIKAVSRSLLAVHKILLQETIREHERREGIQMSPQDAWRAAMGDPFFAWLRPMSQLIAEIDEVLMHVDEVGPGLGRGVRIEVDSLLSGMSSGADFARRYRGLMQESPDLAARHGELKLALSNLPENADGDEVLTRDQWPIPGHSDAEPVN